MPPPPSPQTDAGILRIYALHVSTTPAVPPAAVPAAGDTECGGSAGDASTPRPPFHAACELYVTEEVDVTGRSTGSAPPTPVGVGATPPPPRPRAVAVAGDASSLVVALSDGALLALTWSGDMRGRTRPFDEAAAAAVAHSPPRHADRTPSPLVSLHFCPLARLAVAAFADGRVAASPAPPDAARPVAALVRGWTLRPARGAAPRPVSVAVCGAAAAIAVGLDLGDVELYPTTPVSSGAPPPPPVRTLSPRDGNSGRRGAGPAGALAWSPDGTSLAVGWARGGVCGWTAGTGCRLFGSARAGGDAGFQFDGDDAVASTTARRPPCLEDGVRALAWGPAGRLFVLQPAPRVVRATPAVTPPASPRALPPPAAPCRCLELPLASAVHTRRAGTPAALLADDALWVAAPAAATSRGSVLAPPPPTLAPCRPPPAYLAAAWPLRVASVAPDGATAAVAGGRGVALLTLRTRRWRLFGDAAQEAATVVSSIAWLPRVVVLVGAPPAPALARTPSGAVARTPRALPPPCLTIYPRFHLDAASKLVERRLPGQPAAVDAAGGHILLAHGGGGGGRCGGASADGGAPPPLDVLVLRFDASGPIEPTAALPACTLTAVRSLSVLGAGPPFADAALVVGRLSSTTAPDAASSDAAYTTPHHALLTRHGGRASLLDLETGAEAVLARSRVDRVWLPPDDTPSGPLWGCGPAGMRLWLPPDVAAAVDGTSRRMAAAEGGARAASAQPRTPAPPSDPELEFDPEAYPIAVTPCGDAAIAVRQRVVRRAAAAGDPHASPLFLPEVAAQPLLSVVLRRLLVAVDVAAAGAAVAARAHAPAAAASLEWLVFTSLDAVADAAAKVVKLETHGASQAELTAARTAAASARALLHGAAAVSRAHARHADIIISVARKTDASLWPPLFDAAGPPSDLLADAVAAGRLDGGAAALVVVDRVEGAAAAHALALSLLKTALDAGRERLAAELLRFIVPPAPCGGVLPPDLGGGRVSGEGGDDEDSPPPPSLWSSLARLVAPPPPPPGAPRGASESTPAAAAAWCCVAAAGHRAVGGRDVRRVAALTEALAAVGASLPALLAAVSCATPRQQSGASLVEALEGVLQGEGGDEESAAAALAAATAAGAADWALALALASADGHALADLIDTHSLLWADARRALASARVPPRVAAAADGAEAARVARAGG